MVKSLKSTHVYAVGGKECSYDKEIFGVPDSVADEVNETQSGSYISYAHEEEKALSSRVL